MALLVAVALRSNPATATCSPPRGLPRLVVSAGTVTFLGSDPEAGAEPWVSDGSSGGTRRLVDANAGPKDSNVRLLGDVGGRVVFGTDLGLWGSDGTEDGTQHLSSDLGFGPFAVANGALFFAGGGDTRVLWKTDGTMAGTTTVPPFEGQAVYGVWPAGATVLVSTASTLWSTDGTEPGTRHVFDGPASNATTLGDGTLVESDGAELWWVDHAGAAALVPLEGGPYLTLGGFCLAGPFAFFSAIEPGSSPDQTLWRTTGPAESTVALATRAFGAGNLGLYDSASIVGGPVLLSVAGNAWRTDGTAEGTIEIAGAPSVDSTFVTLGGRTFFLGYRSGEGTSVWTTDGTDAGTRAVTTLPRLAPSRFEQYGAGELVATEQAMFFLVEDAAGAAWLWRSDGTATGTKVVTVVRASRNQLARAALVRAVRTLRCASGPKAARTRRRLAKRGTAVKRQLARAVKRTPSDQDPFPCFTGRDVAQMLSIVRDAAAQGVLSGTCGGQVEEAFEDASGRFPDCD